MNMNMYICCLLNLGWATKAHMAKTYEKDYSCKCEGQKILNWTLSLQLTKLFHFLQIYITSFRFITLTKEKICFELELLMISKSSFRYKLQTFFE